MKEPTSPRTATEEWVSTAREWIRQLRLLDYGTFPFLGLVSIGLLYPIRLERLMAHHRRLADLLEALPNVLKGRRAVLDEHRPFALVWYMLLGASVAGLIVGLISGIGLDWDRRWNTRFSVVMGIGACVSALTLIALFIRVLGQMTRSEHREADLAAAVDELLEKRGWTARRYQRVLTGDSSAAHKFLLIMNLTFSAFPFGCGGWLMLVWPPILAAQVNAHLDADRKYLESVIAFLEESKGTASVEPSATCRNEGCGFTNRSNARFCARCGTRLGE